jgi:hypothetical protein
MQELAALTQRLSRINESLARKVRLLSTRARAQCTGCEDNRLHGLLRAAAAGTVTHRSKSLCVKRPAA